MSESLAAPADALSPASARAADYSGRSNLALAFHCLPRAKRADMNIFYTFCRVVDDIADSETLLPDEKAAQLAAWRAALLAPEDRDGALLIQQLRGLIARYGIAVELLLELITGVESDLTAQTFQTFEQLRTYCYRVASVVGLVSIEIFGYRDPNTRRYAVDLGLALQLTNIVRDVGADLDNGGRIYLPLEDMERFGYPPFDLRARVYDRRFLALMEFTAQRADAYYASAARLLPPRDRRSMLAAEIMRAVYQRLLRKMRADGYHVFDRRYRLGKLNKLWTLAVTMVTERWRPALGREREV